MRLSYNWLKKYVDIPVGADELAAKLIDVGLEVENVIDLSAGLANCRVGKVLEMTKHKESDRLYICKVDLGDEIAQIVTAATNVEEGHLVPVASPGAVLPNGTEINRAEFRGVLSEGMLLSLEELNYPAKVMQAEEREGIFIFPEHEVSPGQSLASALGREDWLLEVDLTPNRADCSSIYGLAQEIAAVYGLQFKYPNKDVPGSSKLPLKITIDTPECIQYYGTVMSIDKPGVASPLWMQNALRNADMRPISAVVDVANYVMLETGHPLHTFDYDTVAEGHIIVRQARPGEKIITLDGQERELEVADTLITDPEKAVGIAGIMGGQNSEITEGSRYMLLESAIFSQPNTRRNMRRMGLMSEASLRYSKGIARELSEIALRRYVELYLELGLGHVMSETIAVNADFAAFRDIRFRPWRVKHLIGHDIPLENMKKYFTNLGFTYTEKPDGEMLVTVPARRLDLTEEVDLIEEVLRLDGYDRLGNSLPELGTVGTMSNQVRSRRHLKALLRGLGADETVNYAFHDQAEMEKLNMIGEYSPEDSVFVLNPLSARTGVMRRSLLPGLVRTAIYNFNRQIKGCLLAEFGVVFQGQKDGKLPVETEMLGILAYGVEQEQAWNIPEKNYDFFSVKGVVEALFSALHIQADFQIAKKSYLHPGRTAAILHSGQELGYIGELHPDVSMNLDLDPSMGRIIYAELNHDILQTFVRKEMYEEVSSFPVVERDLAVVVRAEICVADLLDVIREAGGDLLRQVTLFDLYSGQGIAAGYKSCAFSLSFGLFDRTLVSEEVAKVMEEIIAALKDKFQAELR